MVLVGWDQAQKKNRRSRQLPCLPGDAPSYHPRYLRITLIAAKTPNKALTRRRRLGMKSFEITLSLSLVQFHPEHRIHLKPSLSFRGSLDVLFLCEFDFISRDLLLWETRLEKERVTENVQEQRIGRDEQGVTAPLDHLGTWHLCNLTTRAPWILIYLCAHPSWWLLSTTVSSVGLI